MTSDGAGLLQSYIAEQVAAIRGGGVTLRQGRDAVHPTRVATRRLRSLIRVFDGLVDPSAARALDADLSWYAGLLGAVRERQVLRARFAAVAKDAPADEALHTALAEVGDRLVAEEQHHRDQLMEALDGDRYAALLRTLAAWSSVPPFRPTAAADADLLTRHVAAAGRAADKRLRAATARQDDEALHRARKAAKRARYAAEVARPVLGEGTARMAIDRYKAVQEALGEHQDSIDAVGVLNRLRLEPAGTDEALAAAYEYLLARERVAAQRALAQAVQLIPETVGGVA